MQSSIFIYVYLGPVTIHAGNLRSYFCFDETWLLAFLHSLTFSLNSFREVFVHSHTLYDFKEQAISRFLLMSFGLLFIT